MDNKSHNINYNNKALSAVNKPNDNANNLILNDNNFNNTEENKHKFGNRQEFMEYRDKKFDGKTINFSFVNFFTTEN